MNNREQLHTLISIHALMVKRYGDETIDFVCSRNMRNENTVARLKPCESFRNELKPWIRMLKVNEKGDPPSKKEK